MKIKVGKNIYLQKYDIQFIIKNVDDVPIAFVDELFESTTATRFAVNQENSDYQFVAFERPANIEWIEDQKYILDFSQYSVKTPEEVEKAYNELIDTSNHIIEAYNSSDSAYRGDNKKEINENLKKVKHRLASLDAIIAHYEHEINFELPTKGA